MNNKTTKTDKKKPYRITPMGIETSGGFWTPGTQSKTIVVGERQKHTKTVVYSYNRNF